MPLGAAIGIGGSIIGGLLGRSAAGKAAKAQTQAAQAAAAYQQANAQQGINFQNMMYGQQRGDVAPWLNTGQNSVMALNSLLGLGRRFGGSTVPTTGITSGIPLQSMMTGQVPTAGSTATNPYTVAGLDATTGFPAGVNPYTGSATNRMPPVMTGATDVATAGQPEELPPQGVADANTGATQIDPATGLPTNNAFLVSPNETDMSGGNSYLQPFSNWDQQFQAPTDVTEQNDPGYQFRLDQGIKALQNSAAARGNLLSGATAKAIGRYGQDYASNEYGNTYNRAFQQYQQKYGQFQDQQNTQFNRLMALSGAGQQAAGQLGSEGSQAAGNMSNILLGSGQQVGNSLENKGQAQASGYVGQANAMNSMFGGIGNALNFQQVMNSSYGNPYGPMYPGSDSWMLNQRHF